jgi:peptide deformylase
VTFPVVTWTPAPVPRVILHYPDDRLRLKSKLIGTVDEAIHGLVTEMTKLMYEANGAGLAAIQVGDPVRLFLIAGHVANPQAAETAPPLVFINPKIVGRGLVTVAASEGCLSFPGVEVAVQRYRQVRVQATGLDGKPFEVKAHGFYARAVQHEMEHLSGVLFIDHKTD